MLKIRLLGPRSQVLQNTEDDVRMFFLGSPVRYNLASSGNSNISYPICIHDSPFHFIALV